MHCPSALSPGYTTASAIRSAGGAVAIEATRLLKVERRENRRATHDAETAEAALREVLAKIQNKHRLVPRVAPQTALACQETRRHERTSPRMRNRRRMHCHRRRPQVRMGWR